MYLAKCVLNFKDGQYCSFLQLFLQSSYKLDYKFFYLPPHPVLKIEKKTFKFEILFICIQRILSHKRLLL